MLSNSVSLHNGYGHSPQGRENTGCAQDGLRQANLPGGGTGRHFRRLLSGRCLGLCHTETVQQHIREESHAYVQRGEAGSS